MPRSVTVSFVDGGNHYQVYVKKRFFRKPIANVSKANNENARWRSRLEHDLSANTLKEEIEYWLVRLKLYVSKERRKKRCQH